MGKITGTPSNLLPSNSSTWITASKITTELNQSGEAKKKKLNLKHSECFSYFVHPLYARVLSFQKTFNDIYDIFEWQTKYT